MVSDSILYFVFCFGFFLLEVGNGWRFQCNFFSSFYLVPPTFTRAAGVVDATASPGVRGDIRDVILNNPIFLYCETNAVPPPTLTWYKDGQLLASNDKVLILPGN